MAAIDVLPTNVISSQAKLDAALAEIAAGTYAEDKIELIGLTDGTEFDFSAAGTVTTPVVIDDAHEVTVKNLTATSTNASTPPLEIEGGEVTLDDVDLAYTGTASNGRAVNVAGGSEVTIKNSTLDGNENKAYTRGINLIDGTDETTTITVENSTVKGTYAINGIGTADNFEVVIENSTIEGWAIVNLWGEGTNVTLKNCTLNSINPWGGSPWNTFAAFVINESAENSTITVEDCTVNVTAQKSQENTTEPEKGHYALQYLASMRSTSNNSIVFKGSNLQINGTTTGTGTTMLEPECDDYINLGEVDDSQVNWDGSYAINE